MAAFYSCLRGRNDIMASGSADVTAAHESPDAAEECTGKKKSKFQTFKNLFTKKKRKEAAVPAVESESQLNSSQSNQDVSTPKLSPTHNDKESGSKIDMGDKALSHDSVFTSESPSFESNEVLQASQDGNNAKVKSLQLQLKQAIKLGSPPTLMSMRKSEDGGILSEDDGLPCSPPEYTSLHTVLTSSSQRSSGVVQKSISLSLEGSDSDDDQMSEASSRPDSPHVLRPVDFSQPASSLSCLDNSAAHHRIAVNAKACAKRKPVSKEVRRRNLREKILLRDSEEKLRASRTSTEVEMCKAIDSEDVEQMEEAQEASQRSSLTSASSLAQNEEQLSTSSKLHSAETSMEETCDRDKDHVDNLEIPESSWDCELEADDFLLDTGCKVVSEEQGSLLMEVLSSLKGPLTSGLVLDSAVMVEQMKVKDDAPVCADVKHDDVEHEDVDDVVEELENDGTADRPDFINTSTVLEEEILVYSSLSESVIIQQELEELQIGPEIKEEPEEQDFSTETPLDDLQVHYGENNEKDQEEKNAVMEAETNEDADIMEIVGDQEELGLEEVKEDENGGEDGKADADFVVEYKPEYKDASETEEQEKSEEEIEKEGEIETSEPILPLDEDEEQKIELDERCESDQSVEGSGLISSGVLDQSELPVPHETVEQPSFIVTTSLDLSFPKKTSNPTIEFEDELESLSENATESKQECEGSSTDCFPDHEKTEKIQHENQPTIIENQSDLAAATSLQTSLSIEDQQDPLPEVLPSTDEDEPPNSDESLDIPKSETFTTPETQDEPLIPVHKQTPQDYEEANPENLFGVRLRKTPVLHRYASEGETSALSTQTESEETQKTVYLEQIVKKPIVSKKPDQPLDSVGKPRKTPDLTGCKDSAESSAAPSWISLAKQKQKIFKENSTDESSQEEFPSKDPLPDLSSPTTKDYQKPVASPVKVSCSLEISKPALVEKDKRSHPAPAPLTQDEPPWLALAKKKAKAWSEMPQIVQ